MDTVIESKPKHIGRKIETIRRLRGLTQEFIGTSLGISKQAVSKLEQSDDIDDKRLKEIASVLGVTFEGLKNFKDEGIFYNTNNFYDTTTFNNSPVSAYTENAIIQNPVEKIIELYENLLKVEREKIEILQQRNNG